jgi:hypothetical protein
MDKDSIKSLLQRFNTGEASQEDQRAIEALLEAGVIDLSDLEEVCALQDQVASMKAPDPTSALDRNFYKMLANETGRDQRSFFARYIAWPQLAPKLAFASVTLLVGMLAGYLLRAPSAPQRDQQIDALSQQVSNLQEMMMLSMLEKGSTTERERLKAVGLTREMDEASKKVTNALIQTLNHDENVNVRLAALEALKPYAGDSNVRQALIRSIGQQESPLVQVSLAELMGALQEKAAIKEFEKIMESDKTPEPVKKKIQESINVLI